MDERILIIGVSGTGKSCYAGKLMEDLAWSPEVKFTVFDTVGEHLGLDAMPNVHVIVVTEEIVGQIDWRQVLLKYPRLIVYTHKLSEDQIAAEFDEICAATLEQEDRITFADETYRYAGTYDILPEFQRLVVEGRKFNCGIISVSVRPALLNKLIISSASCIVAFRLHEINDLAAIRPFFPETNRVPSLQTGYALQYSKGVTTEISPCKRRTKHLG